VDGLRNCPNQISIFAARWALSQFISVTDGCDKKVRRQKGGHTSALHYRSITIVADGQLAVCDAWAWRL
jgi:hypothetical protein